MRCATNFHTLITSDLKMIKIIPENHGYESQSKLRGIVPSAVSRQSRDSTYKFQCISILKFESHNNWCWWQIINICP